MHIRAVVAERLLNAFGGLAVFVILSRVYTPDEFGHWLILMVCFQTASLMIIPALEPELMRRRLTATHPEQTRGEALVAYYLLAVPLLSVAGCIYYLLGSCRSCNCILSAWVLVGATLIQGNLVYECLYKAEERFDELVVIRVLTTFVGVVSRIAIAVSGQDVYWLSLAFLAEAIVSAILHVIAVKQGHWRNEPILIHVSRSNVIINGLAAARSSLTNLFAIMTVATHHRLAIFLQAGTGDPKNVALLNAAITVLGYLSMPLTLYLNTRQGGVLKMRSTLDEVGTEFRYWYVVTKLAKEASAYAWVIVAVCLLCSSWAMPLILGERYSGAGLYLVILSPALFAISLGSVRSIHINAIAASDVHLRSATLGILTLIASFLLLNSFSYWVENVMAYALAISLIFSGLFSTYIVKRMAPFGRVQIFALRSAVSWRFLKRAILRTFD